MIMTRIKGKFDKEDHSAIWIKMKEFNKIRDVACSPCFTDKAEGPIRTYTGNGRIVHVEEPNKYSRTGMVEIVYTELGDNDVLMRLVELYQPWQNKQKKVPFEEQPVVIEGEEKRITFEYMLANFREARIVITRPQFKKIESILNYCGEDPYCKKWAGTGKLVKAVAGRSSYLGKIITATCDPAEEKPNKYDVIIKLLDK